MQAGPGEQLDNIAQAVCIKNFETRGDNNLLELRCNDIVYVLEQDETGWWGGHKANDDRRVGWFPGSHVRVLTEEEEERCCLTLPIESRRNVLQTERESPQRGARHVASPQRHHGTPYEPEPAPQAAMATPQESLSPQRGARHHGTPHQPEPAPEAASAAPQAATWARNPRRSAPGEPVGAAVANEAGTGSAPAAPLQQENARLKQENEELIARVTHLRRQSGLDQNNLQELEAAARREREERERAEAERQRLQATLQEERQRRQMLEQQLETERRSSLALRTSMGRVYDGNEELRHGSQGHGRVSEGSSLGCVRRLEGDLRNVEIASDASVAGPVDPRRGLQMSPDMLPAAHPAVATAVPSHGQRPAQSPVSTIESSPLGEKEFCSVTTWRPPQEEPTPGIVAQKVSLFNSKVVASQRSASCSRIRDHHSSRSEGRHAQSPLVLTQVAGASSAVWPMPTCPALPFGNDEAQEDAGNLITNMSPLSRKRPEGFGEHFSER